MLENRRLKTEELLTASKLEIKSLKEIVGNLEDRIESLKKNEESQKNLINRLTNMLEEEQNHEQEIMAEVCFLYLLISYMVSKVKIL
jgi:chromosome segregation ATPase